MESSNQKHGTAPLKAAVCIIAALAFVFAAVLSTGCAETPEKGEKLSVVTTIFPIYDWVKQIVGGDADNAEITMLLDNGVDLHNYLPTADDIVKISSADIFIYVGGESDSWVNDVLKSAGNKDVEVINLLDVLGDAVKEEELAEGMTEEEDEEEGDGPEYDEHVWLSLHNAAVLCRYISEKLCEADPDNADSYRENVSGYTAKLNALDEEYKAAVEAAPVKTLVFGDRFPFRYLTDDYDLTYYAAFAGCSAETEASFKTIVFLAGKVDEYGLHAVVKIEGSDGTIARTVRDNTKAKDMSILTFDSMQSKTISDAESGVTYLSVMENNLSVLKEALK